MTGKIVFADDIEANVDSIYSALTYGEVLIGDPRKFGNHDNFVSKIAGRMESLWGPREWLLMFDKDENGYFGRDVFALWLVSDELVEEPADRRFGSHCLIVTTLNYDEGKTLSENLQDRLGHLKWGDIAENYDW